MRENHKDPGVPEALLKYAPWQSKPRNVPRHIDVVALRRRLGMSQKRFAAWFGFPVATLRHWERGDRPPRGAALVLLNVIDRDHLLVLRALKGRPGQDW